MRSSCLQYLLLVVSFLAACSSAKEEPYRLSKSMHWLAGRWTHTANNGIYLEWWNVQNDSTLVGGSRFISEDDTSMREDLILQESMGALNYTAIVHNQNDGQPINFLLKDHSDSVWTFENPMHDFPKRIEYVRLNEDSMVARISGEDESGGLLVESFPLSRVK